MENPPPNSENKFYGAVDPDDDVSLRDDSSIQFLFLQGMPQEKLARLANLTDPYQGLITLVALVNPSISDQIDLIPDHTHKDPSTDPTPTL